MLQRNSDWFYVLNIAGSDFPLKSNSEIVQELKELENGSDVQNLGEEDSWKYENSFPGGLKKEALDMYKWALKNNKTFPRKAPFAFKIVKGSFSGSFHRKFAHFMIQSQISLKFLQYLEDTVIPDEAYFSSLYHNYWKVHEYANYADSSTKIKIDLPENQVLQTMRHSSDKNLKKDQFKTRYTHWGGMTPRCSGYPEHGLCVFGVRDLQWIIQKDCFFAHKFNLNFQPVTLHCLEEMIFNNTFQP